MDLVEDVISRDLDNGVKPQIIVNEKLIHCYARGW